MPDHIRWQFYRLQEYCLANILVISAVQAALIVVLLAPVLGRMKKEFAGLSGRDWLALLGLIALQAGLALWLNRPFAGASEEWESLYSAGTLAMGELELFSRSVRHGTTWQVLLAPFLRVFGLDPRVASFLNIAAALVSTFAIFGISWLLFRNRVAAFSAAAAFALLPAVMESTAFLKGKPMITCGLASVFVLFSLLACRINDWKMYAAALLTGVFLFNTRQELGVYLVLFAACPWLIRPADGSRRRVGLRRVVLVCAPFLLTYACNLLHGLSVFYGQKDHGLQIYESLRNYAVFAREYLPAWSPLHAGSMLARILLNGADVLRFWFGGWGIIPLLLSFSPLAAGATKERREYFFLALGFVLLNAPYLIHNSFPEKRLFAHVYPLLCVLSAYGFSTLTVLAGRAARTAAYASGAALLLVFSGHGIRELNFREPPADYRDILILDGKLAQVYGERPFTILAGSLDFSSMWRFLTGRETVLLQSLSPNLDSMFASGADTADYRLPLDLLGGRPLVLVWNREGYDGMAAAREAVVRRQCRVGEVLSAGPFSAASVSGCARFVPGGANPVVLSSLLGHLSADGIRASLPDGGAAVK